MSPNEWLAIGMIAAFFVLLIIGIPVAISIAVTAFVFGYLGFGPMLFNLLPSRIYGVVTPSLSLSGSRGVTRCCRCRHYS